MDFVFKMMGFAFKFDGFCIQNGGFCIQIWWILYSKWWVLHSNFDGFCIQNGGFCIQIDGFVADQAYKTRSRNVIWRPLYQTEESSRSITFTWSIITYCINAKTGLGRTNTRAEIEWKPPTQPPTPPHQQQPHTVWMPINAKDVHRWQEYSRWVVPGSRPPRYPIPHRGRPVFNFYTKFIIFTTKSIIFTKWFIGFNGNGYQPSPPRWSTCSRTTHCRCGRLG